MGSAKPLAGATRSGPAGLSTPAAARSASGVAARPERHARAGGPARARALGVAGVASGVALVWGALQRDRLDLTPRAGLGYALGVVGLACMLALLLYSVRKRVGLFAEAGPIRHWFQVHMILGLAGPLAILFHAGFEARSPNGAAALVAMLLVAASGVIGRFVYTRVHLGLFGERQTLRDATARADASREALRRALARAPGVLARVERFESGALREGEAGVLALLLLAARARRVQRAARAALHGAAGGRELEAALRAHLARVRRVAGFAFWERVLSLWHALHLPLCVVLFVAAALHVFAVHRF